jgi:hypothetical protein
MMLLALQIQLLDYAMSLRGYTSLFGDGPR